MALPAVGAVATSLLAAASPSPSAGTRPPAPNAGEEPAALLAFLMAALAVVVLASPSAAQADAGVPMLALVWPASWILFIPVVAIEAWVATRIVGMPFRRSVVATTAANATSTLVGIPLVWALLVLVELAISGGGKALGTDSFWLRIYAVTVQAAWLIPYESELHWMVPAAAMALLVPFFFASVLVERLVFRRFCGSKPELARQWSWLANAASYGFLLVALVVMFVVAVVQGPPDVGSATR